MEHVLQQIQYMKYIFIFLAGLTCWATTNPTYSFTSPTSSFVFLGFLGSGLHFFKYYEIKFSQEHQLL